MTLITAFIVLIVLVFVCWELYKDDKIESGKRSGKIQKCGKVQKCGKINDQQRNNRERGIFPLCGNLKQPLQPRFIFRDASQHFTLAIGLTFHLNLSYRFFRTHNLLLLQNLNGCGTQSTVLTSQPPSFRCLPRFPGGVLTVYQPFRITHRQMALRGQQRANFSIPGGHPDPFCTGGN